MDFERRILRVGMPPGLERWRFFSRLGGVIGKHGGGNLPVVADRDGSVTAAIRSLRCRWGSNQLVVPVMQTIIAYLVRPSGGGAETRADHVSDGACLRRVSRHPP